MVADTESRRPPIKRALLIGVSYQVDALTGPQYDVERLHAFLRDHYEYSEDNITLMLDNQGPKYLPNSVNVFLKETLVDPLPPHCTLTGIFDCCHSGTMLDLGHYHNPLEEWEQRAKHITVSVPIAAQRSRNIRPPFQARLFHERRINSEMVQSDKLSLNEAPVSHVRMTGKSNSFSPSYGRFPNTRALRLKLQDRSLSPLRDHSPRNQDRPVPKLRTWLFSLGGCKDDQSTWESKDGGLFTWFRPRKQALLQALEANPHPTLGELLSRIHSLIRVMVKNMVKDRPDIKVDELEPSVLLGNHDVLVQHPKERVTLLSRSQRLHHEYQTSRIVILTLSISDAALPFGHGWISHISLA
ncbi:hypothetical protein JAAARDRAFT_79824 [Jaapia argillacea MUCL 33604]|uniref:Uncharacterized protein n=1 Tax=Jaapia argillacea MUCL 33604 TaxID=933084 RepID=A0A067PKN1_9AGAM|nr:hypothetical protein JAAARDRAFT_79824 [Jaapia argillacea MUCL 33604]